MQASMDNTSVYNRRLDKIALKYGLTGKYPYKPYYLLRRQAFAELKNIIESLVSEGKKLCVIIDTKSDFFKSYTDKLQIVHYSRIEGDLCRDIRDNLIKVVKESNDVDVVISCIEYIKSNKLTLSVLDSDDLPFDYIDIYEYLDIRRINLAKTSLFHRKLNSKHSFLWNGRETISYYGYHFKSIKRALSKNEKFYFHAYSGYAVFFEMSVTYKRYKKKRGISRNHDIFRLLEMYLDIRDFKSLFELAEEIKDKKNFEWVKKLVIDIQVVLDDLERTMNNKQANYYILNWLDSASYRNMIEDMPWLTSVSNKAIDFKNTYTAAPWTSMTFKTIFSGKKAIRDKLFLYDGIENNPDTYPVYSELVSNGIKLKYSGTTKKSIRVFKDRCDVPLNRYNEVYPCCTRQWDALCYLAEKDENTLMFIHDLYEAHSPFYSVNLNSKVEIDDWATSEEQKRESRKLVDQQLEWWEHFYGNCTEIYMSDHGEDTAGYHTYEEDRTHVIFLVKYANDDKHVEESGFVPMYQLGKILIRVLDKADYQDLLQDYVIIENYDPYGAKAVEKVIRNNTPKDMWMQVRVVRDQEGIYVRYADGTEAYYNSIDEQNNLIKEMSDTSRLLKMREICGEDFIDVFKYDFFKKSRALYSDENGEFKVR